MNPFPKVAGWVSIAFAFLAALGESAAVLPQGIARVVTIIANVVAVLSHSIVPEPAKMPKMVGLISLIATVLAVIAADPISGAWMPAGAVAWIGALATIAANFAHSLTGSGGAK